MIETPPTDFILLTVSLSRLWRFIIGTDYRKFQQDWLGSAVIGTDYCKYWQDWLGGMRGIGRACSARNPVEVLLKRSRTVRQLESHDGPCSARNQ
jgi:hypothetical protein